MGGEAEVVDVRLPEGSVTAHEASAPTPGHAAQCRAAAATSTTLSIRKPQTPRGIPQLVLSTCLWDS